VFQTVDDPIKLPKKLPDGTIAKIAQELDGDYE